MIILQISHPQEDSGASQGWDLAGGSIPEPGASPRWFQTLLFFLASCSLLEALKAWSHQPGLQHSTGALSTQINIIFFRRMDESSSRAAKRCRISCRSLTVPLGQEESRAGNISFSHRHLLSACPGQEGAGSRGCTWGDDFGGGGAGASREEEGGECSPPVAWWPKQLSQDEGDPLSLAFSSGRSEKKPKHWVLSNHQQNLTDLTPEGLRLRGKGGVFKSACLSVMQNTATPQQNQQAGPLENSSIKLLPPVSAQRNLCRIQLRGFKEGAVLGDVSFPSLWVHTQAEQAAEKQGLPSVHRTGSTPAAWGQLCSCPVQGSFIPWFKSSPALKAAFEKPGCSMEAIWIQLAFCAAYLGSLG